MIASLRNEVLSIIQQNKSNEVTCHTDIQEAGIYMLYVDCFDDETIIPFYIGQTINFQARHKQHFTEIMALNRLNRECYEHALFTELYNGHARPCKIFSYMVNHGCSLNDLHMIILEAIDDEPSRLEKESEYINNLYAPFFGFNQINSVLRHIEYTFGSGAVEQYIQASNADIDLLLRFPEYGYNRYNWYRVCEAFDEMISLNPMDRIVCKTYVDILECKKRLRNLKVRIAEVKRYILWQAQDEAWTICKETIDLFFSSNRLRSSDKKKLVVKVLLFNSEDDRNELKKYFEKHSEGVKENLLTIIERIHGKEIQEIRNRVILNQNEYSALEEEKNRLNNIALGTLLPKQYLSHPLGAFSTKIKLKPSSNEENVCYINIEYTCFKSDYSYDFYPEICRIDYLVIRDGKECSKTVYIENDLMGFFVRDDVYYCESGFKYGPFSPYLLGKIGTHIPVSMEYKNGINEWTMQNVQKENFEKVFREINKQIDDKTKVIYTTSGYKSTILRFSETVRLKNLLLAKKLKRLCK